MLPSPELAKYIDDLMRGDLLCWRDLWFGWLLFSTKGVVVGLVLEAPELLYEIISMQRRIHIDKSGWFLRESHVPDWAKVVALLGWLLIVSGVAGEWITSGLISTAEGNIQTFNDILLADTQKETALALERASANEREAARLRLKNSQIIAALRQPSFTPNDTEKLARGFKACPKREITPVLVNMVFTSNIGIPSLTR